LEERFLSRAAHVTGLGSYIVAVDYRDK
jgi:hypothetical protein